MNSFDIVKEEDLFVSTSHNFPSCIGRGVSEEQARDLMCRQIIYIRDNYPARFNTVVKGVAAKAIAAGDAPFAVYQGGDKGFTRRF